MVLAPSDTKKKNVIKQNMGHFGPLRKTMRQNVRTRGRGQGMRRKWEESDEESDLWASCKTTRETKTRPSSARRSDSWGMFGCISNTLSAVTKIEQPSEKLPSPAAQRIESSRKWRVKKCCRYTTQFLAALPGNPLFRHDTVTEAFSSGTEPNNIRVK